MLEVRLAGKFDVQCDGKSVILSSRAAQSLFAYLILTAGTLHRREKLAGMLWPEESEQKARTYLRNELWRIRKALPQKSKVEYLLADNLTVGFNPSSAYWLDIAGLKNLSDTATTEELIQALSSYQGELLPGFYEDWVILEREHLQVRFEQKVACLLEVLEKEQRWQDILDWAERWISMAEAPEAAYQALIIAYDAIGDHAKVTSTYERCKEALRQLDLEPSEETRALAFKKSSKIKVPIPLTSFVGREKELKEVVGLFAKSRLITLTGSGGVGKTRLAIQVVAEILDRFPDGLWFLDLAPLTDPALIPNTLANLLGLRESGEIAVTELLINYFRTRTGLVIFDNCEHLIDASAQLIHSLLTSCKNIAILATSRETLRVAGELPYRVPSLKIPKPNTKFNFLEISSIEAVKLFVDRAIVAAPRFALSQQNAETVAQICQRVDGIPLAIELAAARSNMLPLEQVLKRLDDRFDLLTGGSRTALPRHQTLHALIDWSHALLLELECVLLRRLSVFAGGWTLEAAESVCIGDGVEVQAILDLMTQLANKSLIISAHTQGQEARYRMLETIRQYASERLLTSGEADRTRNRHFEYFLRWVERVEPRLRGPQQLESLDQIEAELDNLRAALDWSLAQAELGEASLRLAGTLLPFWEQRGYMSEGRAWLARALDNQAAPKTGAARAKALNAAGFLSQGRGDAAKSRALLEESVTLWLELGPAGKSGLAYALATLGELMRISGDPTTARSLESEAATLFREQDDRWGLAYALSNLGLAIRDQGDFALARSVINESIELWRDLGVLWELVMANRFLGLVALRQGDYQLAQRHFGDWVELARKLNNKESLAWAILDMGEATLCFDDRVQAKSFMEESLNLFRELGNKLGMANSLYYLGLLTQSEGDNEQAKKILEQALTLAREVGPMWLCADALMGLAGVAAAKGQGTQAARVLGAAEAQLEAAASYWNAAENRYIERTVASAIDQLGAAAFAAARAEGRTMTFEQAADYALRGLQ